VVNGEQVKNYAAGKFFCGAVSMNLAANDYFLGDCGKVVDAGLRRHDEGAAGGGGGRFGWF
jgi:hypothetical protein